MVSPCNPDGWSPSSACCRSVCSRAPVLQCTIASSSSPPCPCRGFLLPCACTLLPCPLRITAEAGNSEVHTSAGLGGSAAEARHGGEGAGRSHSGSEEDGPEHCGGLTLSGLSPWSNYEWGKSK